MKLSSSSRALERLECPGEGFSQKNRVATQVPCADGALRSCFSPRHTVLLWSRITQLEEMLESLLYRQIFRGTSI